MITSFKMEDQNIKMIRGDTVSFGLEFDGLDQDLDTAFFTCKYNHSDEILFKKSLSDGITKDDDNYYIVRIAPNDTAGAEAGKYYYELQIGVNGDYFTILKGVFEIEADVTL